MSLKGRLGKVNSPFSAPVRRSLGEIPGSATQLRSPAVAGTTTTLTAAVATDRFGEADSVFLTGSLSRSCLKGTLTIPNRPLPDLHLPATVGRCRAECRRSQLNQRSPPRHPTPRCWPWPACPTFSLWPSLGEPHQTAPRLRAAARPRHPAAERDARLTVPATTLRDSAGPICGATRTAVALHSASTGRPRASCSSCALSRVMRAYSRPPPASCEADPHEATGANSGSPPRMETGCACWCARPWPPGRGLPCSPRVPGSSTARTSARALSSIAAAVQHPPACRREDGAAAAAAADGLLHHRRAGQVAQRLDGLPRGLVADAGATRRLRDRAALADAAQDVDALVGGLRGPARRPGRGSSGFMVRW